MPAFLARMMIEIPLPAEGAKDVGHAYGLAAIAMPARFGLIGRVGFVGRALQKVTDDLIGRLEQSGADQYTSNWSADSPVGLPA